MKPIKLIAFDLDGTFLYTDKSVPEENLRALEAAAANGTYIVPASGRIYSGIPEAIRALPFVRYCVTINGAYVYDALRDENLRTAEIPASLALRVYAYADTQPVIYDCYKDNWGFMTRSMYERAEEYVTNPGILRLVKTLRTPVESLPDMLREQGTPLQKIQLYVKDMEDKPRIIAELREKFPEVCVTSSLPFNIEINSAAASKGQALAALCEHLGIAPEETLAFGDGTNDCDMLRYAGTGVAMANADEEVKRAADYIAESNDDCGVAKTIRKFMEL